MNEKEWKHISIDSFDKKVSKNILAAYAHVYLLPTRKFRNGTSRIFNYNTLIKRIRGPNSDGLNHKFTLNVE